MQACSLVRHFRTSQRRNRHPDGLLTHLSGGLSPVLVPALAPVAHPSPVACFRGLTLALVVHAGLPPAAAAAAAPGLPGLSVEVALGSVLISEPPGLPFVVAVSVGPDRPAGPAADCNAGHLAVWDFSPAVLPAVPAAKVLALVALPAPDSAAALRRHAAGIGNSGSEVAAVAALGDSGSLNTAAGRQAAGRALVQNCGSTGPSRVAAGPSLCPSARPSAAAHPTPTRGSRQDEPGSSAQGFAE